MVKNFTTQEILNIAMQLNQLEEEKINSLPIKFGWILEKNIEKLNAVLKPFFEFRDKKINQIKEKYSSQEYSIKKEDNQHEIKEEFKNQYEEEIQKLSQELNEIAQQTNEVDITQVDLDKFVENLPDDSSLTLKDVLSFKFMDIEK